MVKMDDWSDVFVNVVSAVNAYLNKAIDNIFKTYQLAGDIADTFRPRIKSGASTLDGSIIELQCDTNIDDPDDQEDLFKVHTAAGEESWKENVVTEARTKITDTSIIELVLTDLVYSGQVIQVNYAKGNALQGVKGDNKNELIDLNKPLEITNNSKAPEVFVSAETDTKGDKVKINFNKDLKVNADDKYSKFTVNEESTGVKVTATKLDPEGSGNKKLLELTLERPLVQNKKVTVNYAKDSAAEKTVKLDDGSDTKIEDFEVAMPVTNNVTPAAGLESAAIIVDGDKIVLTFNQDMKDPAGNKDKFPVKVDSAPKTLNDLSWVDTEPKLIKLILDAPVNGLQTAEVSYDESGTVKDLEDKDIGKFENIPVTNPKYLSAETTRDGKHILLKFDKEIVLADPFGDKDKFIVNKGSAVEIESAGLKSDDNKIIELIIKESIGKGDTVKVKFEGSEEIKSKEGGVLVKFDEQDIVNKSVAPDIFEFAGVSVDGKKVLAHFKEEITANSSNKYKLFNISDGDENKVTAESLDGTKKIIELTLTRDITPEKSVNIWYMKDATPDNKVKSTSGELDNFDPIPANNPVFQSAETSADGWKVLIKFNKEMGDPAGNENNFPVKVNNAPKTVEEVKLNKDDNKTIELKIGELIPTDKPVSFSYKSDTGTVASRDGGKLIKITDQEVTVKVVQPPTMTPKPITDTTGTKVFIKFDKEMTDPSGKEGQFKLKVTTSGGSSDLNFSAAELNARDKKAYDLTVDGTIAHDATKIELEYTAGDVTSTDGGLLASTGTPLVEVEKKVVKAPTCQTAVSSINGKLIILTFDVVMANPSGKETQFKANDGNDNRVTAVALGTNKKTIELTVVRKIEHNVPSLNVAYTAGDVVDANGGKLLSIDPPKDVTNNVKEPPTYQSSKTTKDGNKVIVTFSKAMKDPGNNRTKFIIKMGTTAMNITAAAINDKNIEFTLKKPIEHDKEVKIEYSDEETEIFAADDGILAKLPPQVVTNETTELTTFVSAETSTNGQKIIIKFNNKIKDPGSEKDKFIVKMGTEKIVVNAAASSNTDVSLTLGKKIQKNKVVTVQMTSKNVLDEFDRKLATFLAKNVENKVA